MKIKEDNIITLNEMYHAFKSDIDNQLKEISTKINNHIKSRDYIFSKIKPFNRDTDILNHLNYDVIDISSTVDIQPVRNTLLQLNRIPKGFSQKFGNGNFNKEFILTTLKQLVDLNKIIASEERKKEVLIERKISVSIYKAVARKFNRKINEQILNGYQFSPGSGVGTFYINKKKRSFLKPTINWVESNKYRKELIEAGLLPYQIFERDQEGNILSDNGGVKWFIYYTDGFNLWWNWNKTSCSIKNQSLYNFHPVNGEHSLIRELNKRKTTDTSYHLKFDKNNG